MKVTLQIPENLNEITLAQYQHWSKITENEEINSFYQQKMVEIFCKASLREVLRMKVTDLEDVTDSLDKMFKVKSKFTPTFVLNNVEYGFIPKLDDMTFGEFIDLDNYLSKWETMHLAMTVLFRPIKLRRKNKYLIEEYETADKHNLKNMPLGVCMGALLFFWTLSQELLNHTLKYLSQQKEVDIPQDLRDSIKNGAGFNLFTDSVTETLLPFQKSQSSNSIDV